ncbi:MAG TPA: hypothetical protein EYQ86_06230 [Bacteroidetes bacterium]|nr:hypothetical protein [Bacteroidota bacterium]
MKNKYFTIIKTVLLISISLLFNSAINGQSPNDGYNLIKNGGIENTTSPWGLWTRTGFNASLQHASGNKHSGNKSAKVKITSIGNNSYGVHLYNSGGISVKSGQSYQASVWIKSSGPNATAKLTFRKNSSPYTEYASKLIGLNTGWTMYSLVWDGNNSNTNNVRFTVELGSHTGTVFVDGAIITNCSRPSNYLTLQSSIIGNGRIEMQTTNGTTECLKLGNNSFQQGGQISLKAIPEPGYIFTKWGGANTSGSNNCSISINSNTHINAYFTKTSNVDVDIHYRNKVDWSIAGYDGTIPYVTTNIIDMTQAPYSCYNDGTHGTYNYNKIQAALTTAGNGWTVIYFPPGTYKIKGSTSLAIPNNTVLRGECPNSTTLKLDFNGLNSHSKGCLEIRGAGKDNKREVYSGAHFNSHQISIKNPGPYNVNDFIEITQDNDSKFLDWSQAWGNRQVGEIAKIIGKSGNTLFLDRGLHYSYNPHKNVEVKKITLAKNSGIENLKIYRVDKSESWNIFIFQAYNSWIRNIESKKTQIGHIGMRSSYHCEMTKSYIHDSYSFGSNKRGYGIQIDNQSTSNLVENNIFYKLRHAMILQVGPNGNVFGFNYSRKNIGQYPAAGTYNKKSNISLHGDYPFMNLFESNDVQFIYSGDHLTGSGIGNTFFRNRTNEKINGGWRGGILVKEGSHYHNIIGNEVTNLTKTGYLSNKIIIASNCKNTNQHSNYYKYFNSYKIDNDKRHTLKKSLYQGNSNFNYPYPLENIGLNLPYKAHNIKSKNRFNGNQANAPCLNPCGPASNDTTLITQCGNNAQIQLPEYDAKHVLHAVTVKDYSGSPGNYEVGKPEIYIEIYKNNNQSYFFQSNRALSESGNPPKYISCPNIVLDPNATYRVEIWDYDKHSSDELMGSVTFQGNTSSLNHNNGSNKIRLNKTIYNTIYNWSNGATASSTTITQSGLVSATVTTPNGCESTMLFSIQARRSHHNHKIR